jgi:hypothetical protein
MLAAAGCWGTPSASKADPTGGGTSTGLGTGVSSTSPPTSATASSASTTALDDTQGPTSTDPTGVTFLLEPDVGPAFRCDLFEQDCPPGEKCTVWANDGGSWNATKCVPVVDDPAGPGEPCHVEGSGTSGIDDCDFGAVCWDVDPKALEGVCMPFCVGDASNPYCEDPDRTCPIYADGAFVLCFPNCNPLEQGCREDQTCLPVQDAWICGPDASGDMGAYGDPCEFLNVCDPGLICLGASAVPPGLPCEGATGCCTEVCDITDPAGDQQCAGAAEGQTCQAWYEEGAAPVKWEDVGACALPA